MRGPTLFTLFMLAEIERMGGAVYTSDLTSLRAKVLGRGVVRQKGAGIWGYNATRAGYLNNVAYGRYRLTDKGRELVENAREALAVKP